MLFNLTSLIARLSRTQCSPLNMSTSVASKSPIGSGIPFINTLVSCFTKCLLFQFVDFLMPNILFYQHVYWKFFFFLIFSFVFLSVILLQYIQFLQYSYFLSSNFMDFSFGFLIVVVVAILDFIFTGLFVCLFFVYLSTLIYLTNAIVCGVVTCQVIFQ